MILTAASLHNVCIGRKYTGGSFEKVLHLWLSHVRCVFKIDYSNIELTGVFQRLKNLLKNLRTGNPNPTHFTVL